MKPSTKPRVYNSGNLKGIAKELYLLVKQFPGSTLGELASRYKGDKPRSRGELSKRMAELEQWGAVEKGGVRTCSFSGRQSLTWDAAPGVPSRPFDCRRQRHRVSEDKALTMVVEGVIPLAISDHEIMDPNGINIESLKRFGSEPERLYSVTGTFMGTVLKLRKAYEACKQVAENVKDSYRTAQDNEITALKLDIEGFNVELARVRGMNEKQERMLAQSHASFDALKTHRDSLQSEVYQLRHEVSAKERTLVRLELESNAPLGPRHRLVAAATGVAGAIVGALLFLGLSSLFG